MTQPTLGSQSSRTLEILLGVSLVRACLDLAYVIFVSEYYAYMGLILDYDPVKYSESWFILAVTVVIVDGRIKRPSDFLLFLMYAFLIVPLTSYYALTDSDRIFFYAIIGAFWLVDLVRRITVTGLPVVRNGRSIALGLTIGIIGLVLLWTTTRGGLQLFNLDFLSVYEYREAAQERLYIGSMAYIMTWSFKIFVPALLVYGLWRQQWPIVLVALVIELFLFTILAHRAILIYPILILTVYCTSYFRKPGLWFLLALAAGLSASLAIAILTKEIYPASLLIRRAFYMPAHINFVYHDFFVDKIPLYFSNSFLSPLVAYPYDKPPPRLISELILPGAGGNANTGFLGAGYMQLGYIGMVAYAIIAGVVLGGIDGISRHGLPPWFGAALVTAAFLSMFQFSDLPVAMMTHGLLPALILLWLFGDQSTESGDTRGRV